MLYVSKVVDEKNQKGTRREDKSLENISKMKDWTKLDWGENLQT